MPSAPSPDIDAIVAKRTKLFERFAAALAHLPTNPSQTEKTFADLVREFGEAEVRLVSAINMRRMTEERKPPQERLEIRWREYVGLYRRFGGERPFAPRPAFEKLHTERMDCFDRLKSSGRLSPAEHERFLGLCELLMTSHYICEDLLPETPPKNPPPAGA